MPRLLTFLTTVFLSLMAIQGWAVIVYECEDDQGTRTFESYCPPGTTPIHEIIYQTKVPDESVEIVVTFYSIPECAACDEVRELLQLQGVSVTEKNVNENIEVQNELKELTGDLRVPLVLIGETQIAGYNRSKLESELEAAGHIKPDVE